MAVDADLSSENSATANHQVGSRVVSDDGRAFRYARAGAVTLVPGTLLQASAEVTANQNLAFAAAARGATEVVSTSTMTVTANQYGGGWLLVSVTPSQGYMYKIKSHQAATSAVVTFLLEDPIEVAWTTGTRADLLANPYAGVIINPTAASSAPVGVAVFPVTALFYGWVQVQGPCNLLADGTVVVGTDLSASNATAGAVEAAAGVQAVVGRALTGIATTEYGAVYLSLS